jgi:sulfatase modifying factor 1
MRTVALVVAAAAVFVMVAPGGGHGADVTTGMVRVPAGSYVPLYRESTDKAEAADSPQFRRSVAAFDMDIYPVTNAQFLAFVHQYPEWRRSQARALLVDANYLAHWKSDLDLGPMAPPGSPVTNVSWFAARAYLRAHGKTLPTVDQWEYVAAASDTERDASRDPVFLERLRRWYAAAVPRPLPPVGTGFATVYGARDLHGLVWEWTLDFNSALVTGESRADSALERTLYCGSGAIGAADFENYPAFMRYAVRSSLEGRYAIASVGFRGVRNHGGVQ